MSSNFIKFEDVQGDTSFIRAESIDGVVTAEHDVPVEVDANGQPTSDKTAKKFFLVAILRNGRQVLESFDDTKARDAKLAEVKSLL